MQIKKADFSSTRDVQAIVTLIDGYARDEMGGGQGLSNYSKENLVKKLSQIPHCTVFLAYTEDEPAGIVICFEAFSTFQCRPILNIHDVAVAPNYRGQGISRKLFEAVERHAIDSSCCKMTLEVLEHNQVAKQAYLNFGFKAYELDPKMGKALFFEKPLHP